jgi:hypothetical protein
MARDPENQSHAAIPERPFLARAADHSAALLNNRGDAYIVPDWHDLAGQHGRKADILGKTATFSSSICETVDGLGYIRSASKQTLYWFDLR